VVLEKLSINKTKYLYSLNDTIGAGPHTVGFWNAQIPLMLKLRKYRRTKILLLLKLGIKVRRIITERYRHLILYKDGKILFLLLT
jgi:hypothetical protein